MLVVKAVIALLCLWSSQAWAQVAFDFAIGQAGQNVTSLSQNHTSSGSNRAVFVGQGCGANAPAISTAPTYNSVSLVSSALWNVAHQSNFFRNSGWYMVNQDSGTNPVVVTYDTNCLWGSMAIVSFTGVDQASPVNTVPTPTTNPSSTPQPSITATTGNDEFVVDFVLSDQNCSTHFTEGANQTIRVNRNEPTSCLGMRSSTQDGVDGGVMSWTLTNNGAWSQGAVSFKAAAAGAAINFFSRRRFQ